MLHSPDLLKVQSTMDVHNLLLGKSDNYQSDPCQFQPATKVNICKTIGLNPTPESTQSVKKLASSDL